MLRRAEAGRNHPKAKAKGIDLGKMRPLD